MVEIPGAAGWKSLPKQRKIGEKGRDPDNVKGKKDTEM